MHMLFIQTQNTGVIIELSYLRSKTDIMKETFLMWYIIQTVHFSRPSFSSECRYPH